MRSNSSSEGTFPTSDGMMSMTARTKVATWDRFCTRMVFVDTPGLCDVSGHDREVLLDIAGLPKLLPAGCHALLLVVNPERFTAEAQRAVEATLELLGGVDAAASHLILVFSHGQSWSAERILQAASRGDMPRYLRGRCLSCFHSLGAATQSSA